MPPAPPPQTGPEIALEAIVVATLVLAALVVVLGVVVVVLRIGHTRRAARRARLHARWRPFLLDVIEGEAGADDPRARLDRRDVIDGVHFLLAHAYAVKGEALDRLAAVAAPHLGVLGRGRTRRDPALRLRAVQALGLLGGPDADADLVAALDDPSDLVAMTAAQMLARRGRDAHAALVVDRLDRFRLWGGTTVASMLTRFGPAAGPRLLALFADPARGESERTMAGDALRWLNLPGAAPVAVDVLGREPGRELRAVALRLLRRVGQSADAAVVRPFVSDDDPVLRIHAVSAYGALAPPDDALRVLEAAFDDPSHWVALRAARGLVEARHGDRLRRLADSDHPRAALARQVLLDEMRP